MSADARDLLLDLTERLERANAALLEMAHAKRDESLSVDFTGVKHSMEADRLEAKAEGVRLALSYCNESWRFAQNSSPDDRLTARDVIDLPVTESRRGPDLFTFKSRTP